MTDYDRTICWLNSENALKFISLLPPELADLILLETDDGGIILSWKD